MDGRNFYAEQRMRALGMFLEVDWYRIKEINDRMFRFGDSTYYVLTDKEADEMENSVLENYIDDVVLITLPENLRHYFDREKWKDDARYAGRGNALSGWDGEEHEVTMGWDNITYYIYRN